MADFGGFNITTPQEVQADQSAVRQKAIFSGNINTQRSTNIETALDTIFGNPQLNLARKVQGRLASAQTAAGAEQNPGESDLDYNIRKLQSMRDSISDVDPASASQINTQILKLGEVKFQQGLLTAQDKRAQETFDLNKPVLKSKANEAERLGGKTYVIDTSDPTGNFKADAFDLNDATQTADFNKAANTPKKLVVTPAQAVELWKDNSDNAFRLREAMAKAGGGVGKNTWNDLEKQGAGVVSLYDTADRMFSILKANPDALSAASKGAKELDKFSSQLVAAAHVANGNTTSDGTNLDTWMKSNNVTNSRMQSMIISLAFSIAKAQNGTGRITDRDLIAAKETLGGDNPNPAVITSNLNDMLTARTNELDDRIGYLDSDGSAPPFVHAMKNMVAAKRQGYAKNHAEWIKGQYESTSGATPQTSPQAPAAAADGWVTLPNGVRIREKK